MANNLRSKRWVSNGIALAVAITITTGVTAVLHARVSAADAPSTRAPMPVASITFSEQASFEREQRFLGLVQAASRSEVGFELPGAIAAIHVQEGERVEAGQALASLDTQSLEARQRAARARVEQVRAELELARARSERQSPLANSGAISQQAFDDTRLGEKALISALETARAQLQALDIDLQKSVLRAPYDARVGRQLLDLGAVTQPGSPVFTLTSTSEREAHIGVAVEQARFLQPGKFYPLTWRDQTVSTELRAVRADVNPVSMTTVAIFALPPGLDAFDGEPVAVSVPRTETETGGWLPVSALIEGQRGVWTVLALRERGGNTVALREVVEVLHVSGDQAYVHGSLKDRDEVIADGVHRIAPGTRVAPQKAGDQRLAEA